MTYIDLMVAWQDYCFGRISKAEWEMVAESVRRANAQGAGDDK